MRGNTLFCPIGLIFLVHEPERKTISENGYVVCFEASPRCVGHLQNPAFNEMVMLLELLESKSFLIRGNVLAGSNAAVYFIAVSSASPSFPFSVALDRDL